MLVLVVDAGGNWWKITAYWRHATPRHVEIPMLCCSTMINCIFPSGNDDAHTWPTMIESGCSVWEGGVALEYKLNWKLHMCGRLLRCEKKKLLFCAHCFTRQSSRVHVLTSKKNANCSDELVCVKNGAGTAEIKGKTPFICDRPGMTPRSRVDPFRILCVYLFIIHIISTSVFFFFFCCFHSPIAFVVVAIVSQWCNNSVGSVRCTTGSNQWSVLLEKTKQKKASTNPGFGKQTQISDFLSLYFLSIRAKEGFTIAWKMICLIKNWSKKVINFSKTWFAFLTKYLYKTSLSLYKNRAFLKAVSWKKSIKF